MRNKLLTQLHNAIKKEENQRTQHTLCDIEHNSNNNTKTYEAVKNLKKLTPKQPLMLHSKEELTFNEEKQTKIIVDCFRKILFKNNSQKPNLYQKKSKQISKTSENTKSPGKDGVVIEMIKNAPDIIIQKITEIYNITAETGTHPNELTHGILKTLQKSGKLRGPVAISNSKKSSCMHDKEN